MNNGRRKGLRTVIRHSSIIHSEFHPYPRKKIGRYGGFTP
nr:MAG TPA: hypothetical protein [Caudoviricetes sp.]